VAGHGRAPIKLTEVVTVRLTPRAGHLLAQAARRQGVGQATLARAILVEHLLGEPALHPDDPGPVQDDRQITLPL
jgi:hypothetical protein